MSDDATTAWEDLAVPRWAKPMVRRSLRRLERDVARARVEARTHDDLAELVYNAGCRFGLGVNATDRIEPWVETTHREGLHEAAAEIVRQSCAGYRGSLDTLVAACWRGIGHERDW